MLGGSGHLSPAGQGVLSTLTRGGCCGVRDLASAIDLLGTGTGTGTGRGMWGRHTVPPAWHCHPPSWWPWGCRAEQQRDLVSSPLTRHLSPGLQHSRPPRGAGGHACPHGGLSPRRHCAGWGAQPCPQSGSPPVGWDSQSSFHGEPTSSPLFAPQLHGCCLSSLFSPPPLPSPRSLQAMAHAGALHTPEDPKERGGAQPPRRARGDSPHPCPPERQEPSDLPMQQAVSARAAGCTDPAVPMLPPCLSWGCHCCPPLLFFPKVSPPLPWGCMRLAVEVWGS